MGVVTEVSNDETDVCGLFLSSRMFIGVTIVNEYEQSAVVWLVNRVKSDSRLTVT